MVGRPTCSRLDKLARDCESQRERRFLFFHFCENPLPRIRVYGNFVSSKIEINERGQDVAAFLGERQLNTGGGSPAACK